LSRRKEYIKKNHKGAAISVVISVDKIKILSTEKAFLKKECFFLMLRNYKYPFFDPNLRFDFVFTHHARH